MPNPALTTNLLILGTIEALLDLLDINESRKEIKDALLTTLMARFLSSALASPELSAYLKETIPDLNENTDPATALSQLSQPNQSREKVGESMRLLLLDQAKQTLLEFASKAQATSDPAERAQLIEVAFAQ